MMEFGWLNPIAKWLLPKVVRSMRRVDYEAAQAVDVFWANSQTTAKRIRKYYDRGSDVIYPGAAVPTTLLRDAEQPNGGETI